MFQDYDFFTPNYVQQGWQCPICKRVYAPHTTQCFYCGNQTVITSDKVIINAPKTDGHLGGSYTWHGISMESRL